MKERLGIRHRYRKNREIMVSENSSLVEGQTNPADPEAHDDYTPTPIARIGASAARPQSPPMTEDDLYSPPRSRRESQAGQLIEYPQNVQAHDGSSPGLSYYSPGMLPSSSTTQHNGDSTPQQYQISQPPLSSPRRTSATSNIGYRGSPARPPRSPSSDLMMQSQGGEFEMRVRSGASTPSNANDPRAPDEVHPGPVRERQLAYSLNGSTTTAPVPPRVGSIPTVVVEESHSDATHQEHPPETPWTPTSSVTGMAL